MGSGKRSRKPRAVKPPTTATAWSKAVSIVMMVIIMGPAGGFMGGMVGAAVSFDLRALQLGAGDLFTDVIVAAGVGIGVAVAAGLATAPFDRGSIVPFATIGGLVGAVGYFLYSVSVNAWTMSPWGARIGGSIGALLGIPAGLAVSREEYVSPSLRAAAMRATRAPGQRIDDVDWWRADLRSGDTAADTDAEDAD
ncbi:hypothetical protein [Tropicimonas sp. IMCC6043]|uniref:hypothetical protein n=1 Tax=Tropicimonas sp. IMCC6043 TaxID=2510645 RepID=UPI00101B9E2A|nr:hypothetical protein [Tropicimonas sp. IMCC6043]RYH07612.1 hypothetical protein EU800_19620 [Tropicimonas sp. IMCC6043]